MGKKSSFLCVDQNSWFPGSRSRISRSQKQNCRYEITDENRSFRAILLVVASVFVLV